MVKVLIWQVSPEAVFKDKSLKILEEQHNGIKIVGELSGGDINKVSGVDYDILLVVGAKKLGINKAMQDATKHTLPEEKFLGDWIVCIPGFTLDKYRELQRSRLSIFSRNCFGGFISHLFNLPFRSPFVNMFLKEQNFIRFLQEPHTYLEKDLVFRKLGYEVNLKRNYPIVNLGDLELHMNHYINFDEAVDKWNERKQRINWQNLLVTMSTSSEEILKEFAALPYVKKICFVPFKSDLNSAWYIDPNILKREIAFTDIVNGVANGVVNCYDLFDMLLYGKKTPLIDM